MAIAESILVRLERSADGDWVREQNIAWANRLLGRTAREREALERMVRGDADTLPKLEALGRIAILSADTVKAARIDSILAAESNRPLMNPKARGAWILARARIAAGLGRREQAVALLKEASARGMLPARPVAHLSRRPAARSPPGLSALRRLAHSGKLKAARRTPSRRAEAASARPPRRYRGG